MTTISLCFTVGSLYFRLFFTHEKKSPVAQWVKPWPADLVVVGSSPAGGGDLFNCNRGSIAHSLSISSTHHPDLTEILLKRM